MPDNIKMKTYNQILSYLIVPALALSLMPLHAADNNSRSSKQVREGLNQLRDATLQYLTNQLNTVRSAEDYQSWLAGNLSSEDRKEATLAFSKLKKIEPVRHTKDSLIFQADGKTVTLTWPDANHDTFALNGVEIKYDSSRSLKTQFEEWATKASSKRKNALLMQILPEADALAFLPILYWVGTAAGGAFVGTIVAGATGETFKNARCWITKGTELDGDDCINMRKARLEAQQAGMPTFDAVKNMSGSDSSNVLSKFEGPQYDQQCPSNNDGKDRFLKTAVRTVRAEGGKKIPTSDWVYVWVKLNAKGEPQDMILSSTPELLKPEMTTTAAGAERLIAHIAFDPTTNRPVSFRVPNPESGKHGSAGILVSPTLNLNLAMNLKPEQKDIINNAVDIVKWVIYRTYNCVTQNVVAEQQAGIASGSPAQPKTETEPKATH